MSRLSHSHQPSMDAIERDYRAREDAESAAMNEAELRAQYDRMCSEIKARFPVAASAPGGLPSYDEFKTAYDGGFNA